MRQTIPANIENNRSYDNLEFILLDYNSSDGLEDWVKNNMVEYLENGRLKYYRTEEPLYFDRTHSRNLMFKLATGEILCNVDADNFTGKNYATFINEEFNKEKEIFIVADTLKRYYFLRNAFGRFCCSKETYLKIGGMDESMKSYGSETLDLYERLRLLGLKEVIIRNTKFLKAINHTDEERIENEFFYKNILRFYMRFYSHEESEILFLFRDQSYERCRIIPEKIVPHLPAALQEGTFEKGSWSQQNSFLTLSEDKTLYQVFSDRLETIENAERQYYEIKQNRFLQNVAKNYSFIVNTRKLQTHQKRKNIQVNDASFGLGAVTFNFDKLINTF